VQQSDLSEFGLGICVLELGEDECGPDDLGGLPGAGGDALEGGPALAEQGESSFSLAAEAARSTLLRVFVSGPSRWFPGGFLTGTQMPIPAPS
jgi:hypothetical protein